MKLLQQDLKNIEDQMDVGSPWRITISNARKKLEALEIVEGLINGIEDCIDAVHVIDELQEELNERKPEPKPEEETDGM